MLRSISSVEPESISTIMLWTSKKFLFFFFPYLNFTCSSESNSFRLVCKGEYMLKDESFAVTMKSYQVLECLQLNTTNIYWAVYYLQSIIGNSKMNYIQVVPNPPSQGGYTSIWRWTVIKVDQWSLGEWEIDRTLQVKDKSFQLSYFLRPKTCTVIDFS